MTTTPDYHPSPLALHYARLFATAVIPLLVVATVVFAMRLWTRTRPVFRLSLDDYACSIGYVCLGLNCGLSFRALRWVFGSHDVSKQTVADIEKGALIGFVAQLFWAWSMTATKCSVALMLLRLEREKPWRRFLWAVIVLQALLGLYNMVAQLIHCIPLNKAWDLQNIRRGGCWSDRTLIASQITVEVLNVVTDWICALLPISFLRRVQRPRRERFIISLLMALGVFAGAVSVVKIRALVRYGYTGDPRAEGIRIGEWACVEELVAFITACVPCLRGPFQRVLEYFSLASKNGGSSDDRRDGRTYGQSRTITGGRSKRGAVGSALKMKRLHEAGLISEDHIHDDTAETAKMGEIWVSTEVCVEEEQRSTTTLEQSEGRPRMS